MPFSYRTVHGRIRVALLHIESTNGKPLMILRARGGFCLKENQDRQLATPTAIQGPLHKPGFFFKNPAGFSGLSGLG